MRQLLLSRAALHSCGFFVRWGAVVAGGNAPVLGGLCALLWRVAADLPITPETVLVLELSLVDVPSLQARRARHDGACRDAAAGGAAGELMLVASLA